MSKFYYSLGLMSGTSADGIDASIIQSDGDTDYKVILDKYFKYKQPVYENIHNLKEKINNKQDLTNFSDEIDILEKEITLFHANAVNEIIKETNLNIDIIGFHGQTIFHDEDEKISKQLGDGKLLSKLTKKNVVYNFRQNDLKNGGRGAPLVPIFHKLLKIKFKLKHPIIFLNIGGIANATILDNDKNFYSSDIGPGNCLIDRWIRANSKNSFDQDGELAKSGKINEIILNQALENFRYEKEPISYDVKDFDIAFVRGLSIEDGAATLTEYTSEILQEYLKISLKYQDKKIIISGGGRKNKFLISKIETKIKQSLILIDEYGIDGDFVESQAFAYLAIRSFLNLPISYPGTTGVKEPCCGGVLIKY